MQIFRYPAVRVWASAWSIGLAVLLAGSSASAAIIASTNYGINCWATSPAPSVPLEVTATDESSFSDSRLCLAVQVPGSGRSQVEVAQGSTVSESGIATTGSVLHTKSGLWGGLGTSQINVILIPDVDYRYDFASVTGEAYTVLEPGFSTAKASFLVQFTDSTLMADLLRATAAGTVGATSGLLLAGHTYTFQAKADVKDTPLDAGASFNVELNLTPVPAPATASLLLAALGFLGLRRVTCRADVS